MAASSHTLVFEVGVGLRAIILVVLLWARLARLVARLLNLVGYEGVDVRGSWVAQGLHVLLGAELFIVVSEMLILTRLGLGAHVVLSDREAHGVHVVEVHLLKLRVLLILLEFLVTVRFVDFYLVHRKLHHIRALAIKRGIVSLSSMALRPKLLNTHERT